MNRIKIGVLTILMSGCGIGASVYADDSSMNNTKNAIEHPETTLHESEAKSAEKNVQEYQQQKAEAKARMDQAKTDYEKSLKDNGAENTVTKDAKKRLSDARKEYRKYGKKASKAGKDLQEDTQKVMEDKATQ